MPAELERHLEAPPKRWRDLPLPEFAIGAILETFRTLEGTFPGESVEAPESRATKRFLEVMSLLEDDAIRVRLNRLERLAWRLRFDPGRLERSGRTLAPLYHREVQLEAPAADGGIGVACVGFGRIDSGHRRAWLPIAPMMDRTPGGDWRMLPVGTLLVNEDPDRSFGSIGLVRIAEREPLEREGDAGSCRTQGNGDEGRD